MARPLLLLVVVPIYIIGSLFARAFGPHLTAAAFAWGLGALIPVVIAAHYANEFSGVETAARRFRAGAGSFLRVVRPALWP